MSREVLLQKLESYSPEFEAEKKFRASFLAFINKYNNCCERSLGVGHITGSAWIINQTGDKALLTHHKKLNRWLQLGGHADGETDIIKVSKMEAEEESGLHSLELYSEKVFDIDIHPIPARKNEPEHLHYDIRYLFIADENEPLQLSEESKDLGWIPLTKLAEKTDHNESILRMAKKSQAYFHQG